MSDLWLPPPPPCASIMQASDSLTIRTTPSPSGRNVGSILAGAVVRVDRRDTCLLYGAKWRYVRLISAVGVQVREPLYIALEEVASAGTVPLLRLVRDECDDVPVPVEPEEPELPEIPEETFMDWVELEVKKLNVILPFLHDKLGTDQFKALLSPQSVAAMQEVIVGASTPDVEPPPVDPPVEPDPETPPPPVEEWPPVEPEPEPPPVVEPPTTTLKPFAPSGNKVLYNGDPFKATGCNSRELPFFGSVMPYASQGDIVAQLDGAKALGMRLIRFYCSHHTMPVGAAIPKVLHVLDLMKQRDLFGVLVIGDAAFSGFHPPDAPGARAGSPERYTHDWIAGGYREKFRPYVDALTKAIGNHSAVYALSPLNELTTINTLPSTAQMEAMISFFEDITGLIRQNCSEKMISTGLESTWQLFSLNAYGGLKYAEKLYSLPNVNLIEVHMYGDPPNHPHGWQHELIPQELDLAKRLKKPMIIGEMGSRWEDESADWLGAAFNATVEVDAWLQWGMSFPYGRDLGIHGNGLWNAPAGTPQARRWNQQSGAWRAWADRLRLALA